MNRLVKSSSTTPSLACAEIGKEQLRRAIECGDIYPVFQPIVTLPAGAAAGLEVLARWHDEALGAVPPERFIRIAEQTELLTPLTLRLIEDACKAATGWGGNFQLAFNLSPLQLCNPALPALIEAIARRTRFPFSRIQFEITESTAIIDYGAARMFVAQLKNLGAQVVLDDFGTGFSSFAWLQALPFDQVKLEGCFVRSMATSRRSRKIVSAVIGLGKSLGIPVVAEGIETPCQMRMLARLGCDSGQGYLFGRPATAEFVPAMLASLGRHAHRIAPHRFSSSLQSAQLNAIYANSSLALCFVDQARRFVGANHKFAELVGIPLNRIIDRFIEDVWLDALPPMADILCMVESGRDRPPMEKVVFSGGRTFLSTIAPACDEDNEVVGVSVVFVDITERKSSTQAWSHGRPRHDRSESATAA